jgi:hypothetical protein
MSTPNIMAEDLMSLIEKHGLSSLLVVIPGQDGYVMLAYEVSNEQLRGFAKSLMTTIPTPNTVLN